MSVGAEFVPTNGIYKCKDGRYIMIESGPPYVKLEQGYLDFLIAETTEIRLPEK